MTRKIRCAVYTRKSTEDGLEQDFNSLDAQFEACAAFIASQKAEGWTLLPARYDDGGISGGTMDRPALQRLLADIAEGRVDRIVVYKIDRLTRSLSDFAKIVDQLDAMEASFVSVTQSFNTATSMGRLTLNMLLSFAQFEREVTAERIRDKIAASKRRGLWMGGTVPLGYVQDGRTLRPHPTEAKLIQRMYAGYLELGSVGLLKSALDGEGQTTRVTKTAEGAPKGGKPFTKAHLHQILTNALYQGKIVHKGKVYDGQHDALIDEDQWAAVQSALQKEVARPRGKGNHGTPSPLIGKLFDVSGDRLTPTHTIKSGKRIHYYVSRRLLTGSRAEHPDGWRLPAREIEAALKSIITNYLKVGDVTDLLKPSASAQAIAQLRRSANKLSDQICEDHAMRIWPSMIQRVDCRMDTAKITFDAKTLIDQLDLGGRDETPDLGESLTHTASLSIRKRGVETKVVTGATVAEVDQTLFDNLGRAHAWYAELKAGATFQTIAARHNVDLKRLRQILQLVFLAPDIAQQIITGRQPVGMTSRWVQKNQLPHDWADQRALLGTL